MKGKPLSLEHKRYLKGLNRSKHRIIASQIILLIVLVAAWQASTDLGLVDSFITSSPKNVAQTFWKLLADDRLLYHAAVTVLETMYGFVVGTLAGTFAAMLLWWFPVAAKVLDPYLVVLNALPKIALGPLILVLAGMGIRSILIMTLAISLISTIITVYSGFVQTDEEKITLLRSFGATKSQLLFKVILPGSYENILSALKINIGLSWVGVIMGEFLVSKAGIGYLIMYGSQVFNLNLVMTGIIALSIEAALMYYLVNIAVSQIRKLFFRG
ncbi:MAG: ABC transporter permease [Eubacteriaceae bacterium]|jgi:NitT/TauT family transport system permease protein|nr:ABC transporter permease [Eubacteriaceae bacterium]